MKKNVLWGLVFILLAVYMVVAKMGYLDNIPVVSICVTVVLAYLCFIGILRRDFFMMFIPVALIISLYRESLKIENMNTWFLIWIAVFLAIGFTLIFKTDDESAAFVKKDGTRGMHISGRNEIKIDNNFGKVTRYVEAESMKNAKIDNNFGNCVVYFTNTELNSEYASLKISNNFGETEVHLPSIWRIDAKKNNSLGSVKIIGSSNSDLSAPYLKLEVDNAFGNTTIYFE